MPQYSIPFCQRQNTTIPIWRSPCGAARACCGAHRVLMVLWGEEGIWQKNFPQWSHSEKPLHSYSAPSKPMERLKNLRGDYLWLAERVRVSLQIHVGNAVAYRRLQTNVLDFLNATRQASHFLCFFSSMGLTSV